MHNVLVQDVRLEIDESAREILQRLKAKGLKLLVTVQATIYSGCCGTYEEKSLKIGTTSDVNDSVKIRDSPPVYIDEEAVALLRTRGSHFTIYADLKDELYSDQ
ncbi:MAG: hypothetical protein HYW93_06370 [Thaumarchaeota archaeon]|nr:hypothetical protein [Nitrososphaerota archaeon]